MVITFFLCVALFDFSAAFSDSDDIYRSKSSNDYVPCENGWYYFRDKCYRVAAPEVRERRIWTGALEECRGYGADLVSIQSQEEYEFIVAYLLLDAKYPIWTGLNDRDKEGDFKWNDGSVFNYSNWLQNEPSQKDTDKGNEDCVDILFEVHKGYVGKWNDRKCEARQYAACEKNSSPRNSSPNMLYCSPKEGGGWKLESSCYHIVTEMKSWQNAEEHCKSNYKGHLLTIRDTVEDLFLELALPDIKEDIWIGIKLQDNQQLKWTSGWYVSPAKFNNTGKYTEDTCVARKTRDEWITVPCSTQLPFICEVSKAMPPVLKPAPKGSYCPKEFDGWNDFGGKYCYYIRTKNYVNFFQARSNCQRIGGDLVSIHSQEEADILNPFLRYTGYSIFVGLVRVKENGSEELFRWTDGSVFDYQNWGENEPNKMEEECVTVMTLTMKWRDTYCSSKESGYVCSVEKIMSSPNVVDETAGCSSHLYLKTLICVSACFHLVMSLLGVML